MWKRLARKPSTASLTPAARNSTKAAHIAPDQIAQTTIGTSRMRPSVMRFGMLKGVPARRRAPASAAGNAPIPSAEYIGGRTIARLAISTYDPGARVLLAHDLFRKPVPIPERVEDMLFGIMRAIEGHHGRKGARPHIRASRCGYRRRQPDGGADQAAGARHRAFRGRCRNRRLWRVVRPQAGGF